MTTLDELLRLIEFDATVFVVDSGNAKDDIRARLSILIDDIEKESVIINSLHHQQNPPHNESNRPAINQNALLWN